MFNEHLILRALADIPAKPVTWLWRDRIPLGKITTIAGDPGLGKSLITTDIAALVSRGRSFPDGAPCDVGDVLLLSAEDDAADTIRPRLESAGADLSRVHVAPKFVYEDGNGELYDDLFTDIGMVHAMAAALAWAHDKGRPIRLIVIDPISAFLGDLDGHKNTEVRAKLAPLAEIAQQWKCAVLLVSHLNKSAGPGSSPLYRVSGSLAFVAAARAVWLVTRDPDDQERRLLLPVKCNLGPDQGGLAYRIGIDNNTPRIEWEAGAVSISASEAMTTTSDGERSDLRDAIDFLVTELADGPLEQKQIERDATGCGISLPTLRRAKKQAGIKSEKAFGNGKWRWRLPDRQDDQHRPTQNVDHLDQVDHLDDVIPQQHDQGDQGDQEIGPGKFDHLVSAIEESLQRTAVTVTADAVRSHVADWPPDDLAQMAGNPGMLDAVVASLAATP